MTFHLGAKTELTLSYWVIMSTYWDPQSDWFPFGPVPNNLKSASPQKTNRHPPAKSKALPFSVKKKTGAFSGLPAFLVAVGRLRRRPQSHRHRRGQRMHAEAEAEVWVELLGVEAAEPSNKDVSTGKGWTRRASGLFFTVLGTQHMSGVPWTCEGHIGGTCWKVQRQGATDNPSRFPSNNPEGNSTNQVRTKMYLETNPPV